MTFTNPKIYKLEDFQVWVEARKLSTLVNEKVILILPRSEEYNLKKHLSEGVRNIPGNIAEGFGRKYSHDCSQFYRVASGSLNEMKSDLYLSLDRGYINQEILNQTLQQWEIVNRLLNGVLVSVARIKPLAKKI